MTVTDAAGQQPVECEMTWACAQNAADCAANQETMHDP